MFQLQKQSGLNIFKTLTISGRLEYFINLLFFDGTMWNSHNIVTNHHFRKQSDCVKNETFLKKKLFSV